MILKSATKVFNIAVCPIVENMTEKGKSSSDYQCTLPPDLVQKAERELNEKAEWRSRDIQALRDMVNKNKGDTRRHNKN